MLPALGARHRGNRCQPVPSGLSQVCGATEPPEHPPQPLPQEPSRNRSRSCASSAPSRAGGVGPGTSIGQSRAHPPCSQDNDSPIFRLQSNLGLSGAALSLIPAGHRGSAECRCRPRGLRAGGAGSGRAAGSAAAPRRPQGACSPRVPAAAEQRGRRRGRARVSLPPGCRNHKPPECIRIIITERFPPHTLFRCCRRVRPSVPTFPQRGP